MPNTTQGTLHYIISATTNSSVPVQAGTNIAATHNADRRFVYIRNYANSTNSIFVLFSDTRSATAGAQGELEIVPGAEYLFGGALKPSTMTLPGSFVLPNCPLEQINVITSTGTASGCVIVQ